MKRYEPGDTATFYFVVMEYEDKNQIRGWTDSKDLAKFYMEFHKCKNLILKEITKSVEEIAKITEENWNDEISMNNITVKNRGKRKKGEEWTIVTIPSTRTEMTFINEECATFMLSQIQYSYLNSAIPYLKGKYQRALSDIFLPTIINKVCNRRESAVTQKFQFDQLTVLLRSFPELFGD